MRREKNVVDQKSLSISDLKIDYLSLYNSVRNIDTEMFLNQGAVTLEVHTQLENDLGGGNYSCNKKSPFNSWNSNIKWIEHNGQKINMCVRCGLDNYFIINCPKPDTSD